MSTGYQSAPLLPHFNSEEHISSESPAKQRLRRAAAIAGPAALVGCIVFGAAYLLYPSATATVVTDAGENVSDHASFPASEVNDSPLVRADLIKHIRNTQSYWTPVESEHDSPFREWTMSRFRKMTQRTPEEDDYIPDPRNIVDDSAKHPAPVKNFANHDLSNLPTEFDAREKWADCQSIAHVRDQGSCGSCWAFGSVAAMSDRVCIASNGKYQHLLSAHDLMGCCAYCSVGGQGCEGGDEQDAYHFWMTEGLVSGDNYQSSIGCQPYPIAISIVHVPGQSQASPTCQRSCTNNQWKLPYAQDKVKAREVYRLPDNNTEAIMHEIMTHGPVSASYTVYDDFPLYKDGVYVKTTDKVTGSHVVSILGWGEENGVKFWWAKNSWNRLWGHHGFFKIRRGTNECGIEQGMVAGLPDVDTLPTGF